MLAGLLILIIAVLGQAFRLSLPLRNGFLLLLSLLFYASLQWYFPLILLVYSGGVYLLAWLLQARPQQPYFAGAILLGLLPLLGFKYQSGSLLFPIGLSFYSLQALSYLSDVYMGRQVASRNLLSFLLYMAFFPKLLLGPIERAQDFLAQIESPRPWDFDQIERGFFLIVQGMFRKLAVVNLIGLVIQPIFEGGAFEERSAAVLWAVMLLNTLYIYLDFSSYMYLAEGAALCLGFSLSPNFARPFFAPNLVEFWNRWHISLSNWLRDYIFMPTSRALIRRHWPRQMILACSYLLTMLVSGLWHGTGWNFIWWGLWHGLLLFFMRALLPSVPQKRLILILQTLFTFLVVNLLFILFVLSPTQTVLFLKQMLSFQSSDLGHLARPLLLAVSLWLLLDAWEWWNGDKHGLYRMPSPLRGMVVGLMLAFSLTGALSYVQNFVYAQF